MHKLKAIYSESKRAVGSTFWVLLCALERPQSAFMTSLFFCWMRRNDSPYKLTGVFSPVRAPPSASRKKNRSMEVKLFVCGLTLAAFMVSGERLFCFTIIYLQQIQTQCMFMYLLTSVSVLRWETGSRISRNIYKKKKKKSLNQGSRNSLCP